MAKVAATFSQKVVFFFLYNCISLSVNCISLLQTVFLYLLTVILSILLCTCGESGRSCQSESCTHNFCPQLYNNLSKAQKLFFFLFYFTRISAKQFFSFFFFTLHSNLRKGQTRFYSFVPYSIYKNLCNAQKLS